VKVGSLGYVAYELGVCATEIGFLDGEGGGVAVVDFLLLFGNCEAGDLVGVVVI